MRYSKRYVRKGLIQSAQALLLWCKDKVERLNDVRRTIETCSGHDYLIKYAYFVKCYLNRFASINVLTTNVAQRKKLVKHDFE